MEECGWMDVSATLGAGVYALKRRGVVVYIGQSVKLFARLSGYFNQQSRQRQVKFGSRVVKGIAFDEVWVMAVAIEDLDEIEEALIRKYLPKYNVQKKVPLALADLCAALISVSNGPPVEAPIRRRV